MPDKYNYAKVVRKFPKPKNKKEFLLQRIRSEIEEIENRLDYLKEVVNELEKEK